MAVKPVKVLTDLLTKKQIIKQDVSGNILFNVSGTLENGHVSSSLPITASYFVGDGSFLTNISASGGISSVSTSGSITGSGLVTNPISLKDPLVINTVTASTGFSGNLYGTASYAVQALSASYAQNSGLSTVKTSGNITGSGTDLDNVRLKDDISLLSVTASNGFQGRLYGTSSYSLTASYAENATVDVSQFPTRAEVTGVLGDYSTLSGVSASFVTPLQVTSALQPYVLTVDLSSSFVENSELTSAISNFSTRNEVTGAINTFLIPYATTGSNTFVGIQNFNNFITGTNALFTGDLFVNGTASIGRLNTINQTSLVVGDKYIVILSGAVDHTSLDGSGILFGSGGVGPTVDENGANAYLRYRSSFDKLEIFPGLRVSGSLSASSGISASYFVGDGSSLTNLPLSQYATLSGVSASFTTPQQVTGALSGYVTNTTFNNFTSSYNTASFSGSFFGTASYATNALSASFATTSSFATNSLTASYVLNAVSSSFATNALTASYVQNVVTFPYSGSAVITGSLTVTGAAGTTVFYSSADTILFTGSWYNSGSVYITGSLEATSGISGSLFGTSSFATTASFSVNTLTASYIDGGSF